MYILCFFNLLHDESDESDECLCNFLFFLTNAHRFLGIYCLESRAYGRRRGFWLRCAEELWASDCTTLLGCVGQKRWWPPVKCVLVPSEMWFMFMLPALNIDSRSLIVAYFARFSSYDFQLDALPSNKHGGFPARTWSTHGWYMSLLN